MANAMLAHMADKLPVSRWRRIFPTHRTAKYWRLFRALRYCLSGNREGSVRLESTPVVPNLAQSWEVLQSQCKQ